MKKNNNGEDIFIDTEKWLEMKSSRKQEEKMKKIEDKIRQRCMRRNGSKDDHDLEGFFVAATIGSIGFTLLTYSIVTVLKTTKEISKFSLGDILTGMNTLK